MQLENIIKALAGENVLLDKYNISSDLNIKGIKFDSRKVQQDDLFICIPGYDVDGHNYTVEAEKNGAVALITERKLSSKLPQIVVNDSRIAMAIASKTFYNNPAKDIILIGITGTNGKSSTAIIIKEILRYAGYKVGLIGTISYWIDYKEIPAERTTPESADIYKLLSEMKQAGCQVVVMEVSSHSLSLHRTYGLEFYEAIFTNLSRDHLDFHKNIENYTASKFKLFEQLNQQIKPGIAILNIDDKTGLKFYNKLSGIRKISFGFDKSADYHIINYQLSLKGTKFFLSSKEETIEIQSSLIGKHNIYNLTCAIAGILNIHLKISKEQIQQGIYSIKNIKGRLEKIEKNNLHIFIDYAHTPDALKSVLLSLREFKDTARIITVFGAGGDRDKGKRQLMGEAVDKLSDFVIITSDNPRTENPSDIIKDILMGIHNKEKIIIEQDRRLAIKKAIEISDKNDIILIAGKGHENYQIIGKNKIHFDDKEIAEELLLLKK